MDGWMGQGRKPEGDRRNEIDLRVLRDEGLTYHRLWVFSCASLVYTWILSNNVQATKVQKVAYTVQCIQYDSDDMLDTRVLLASFL